MRDSETDHFLYFNSNVENPDYLMNHRKSIDDGLIGDTDEEDWC